MPPTPPPYAWLLPVHIADQRRERRLGLSGSSATQANNASAHSNQLTTCFRYVFVAEIIWESFFLGDVSTHILPQNGDSSTFFLSIC